MPLVYVPAHMVEEVQDWITAERLIPLVDASFHYCSGCNGLSAHQDGLCKLCVTRLSQGLGSK